MTTSPRRAGLLFLALFGLLAGCDEPAATHAAGDDPSGGEITGGKVSENGFVHEQLGFGLGFGADWTPRNAEAAARGIEMGDVQLYMTYEHDGRRMPFRVSVREPDGDWGGARAVLQSFERDMQPAFTRRGIESIDVAGHPAWRMDWFMKGDGGAIDGAQRWVCFERGGLRFDVVWDGIAERDLAPGQAVFETWTWYD